MLPTLISVPQDSPQLVITLKGVVEIKRSENAAQHTDRSGRSSAIGFDVPFRSIAGLWDHFRRELNESVAETIETSFAVHE